MFGGKITTGTDSNYLDVPYHLFSEMQIAYYKVIGKRERALPIGVNLRLRKCKEIGLTYL